MCVCVCVCVILETETTTKGNSDRWDGMVQRWIRDRKTVRTRCNNDHNDNNERNNVKCATIGKTEWAVKEKKKDDDDHE